MNLRALGLTLLTATFTLAHVAAQAEATPAPTVATTPAPVVLATPAAVVTGTSSAGGSVQLVIYFLLLLGLFAAGIYIMRNGLGFLQPKQKGPRKLEITETRMLGNRQFLVVAQYEERKMLIGVCPGRIEYLCTLSGPEPEFPRLASEEEG